MLTAIALWQSAGCTVPPPEPGLEPENLPPILEWDLATPAGFWTNHVLQPGSAGTPEAGITFDLTQAVFDPEGDRILFQWYWTGTNGKYFSGHELTPRGTFTLRPCEEGIGDASPPPPIVVEVAVSDRDLLFVGEEDNPEYPPVYAEPIDDTETPEEAAARVEYRTWNVYFTESCLIPER